MELKPTWVCVTAQTDENGGVLVLFLELGVVTWLHSLFENSLGYTLRNVSFSLHLLNFNKVDI